jgi:hypothetical protein
MVVEHPHEQPPFGADCLPAVGVTSELARIRGVLAAVVLRSDAILRPRKIEAREVVAVLVAKLPLQARFGE